jgi:serine/threonine-protein kinase RsbT
MGRLKHIITSEVDLHFMKSEIEELLSNLNLKDSEKMKINTILSELAYNQLKYVGKGSIVTSYKNSPKGGYDILIVAADKGPGIKDVNLALQDSYSTSGTLGLGLPGIKRLADEFEIESTIGEGTLVKASIWIKN